MGTGTDLFGADLTDAVLTGAKLSGADLSSADLSSAILTGADLTGADLTGAILTGTDLTDASLTDADLTDAEISGADSTGANLYADQTTETGSTSTYTAPGLDNTSDKNRAVFTVESADKKWQVPQGVLSVDVHLQSSAGIAADFSKEVGFPQYIEFRFYADQVQALHGTSADDENPLLLATLSASSTDNTVNAQITNLNDSSRRLLSSYQSLSWCDWFNPCPIGYTNLHSDFNPVLDATTSGLKLFNGQPKLKVDFTLPNYYYNVQVSYSQCAAGNDLSLTATAGANSGCDIAYATEVSYVDHCTFDLAQKNGDATAYSYSGELTIRAHLQLTVAGFQVERVVESPLNWVVYLDRQIDVSTDIILENDDTCADNSDCNDQGCCEPTADDPNVNFVIVIV